MDGGQAGRWMDGQMGEKVNGRCMDGNIEGWMDGCVNV